VKIFNLNFNITFKLYSKSIEFRKRVINKLNPIINGFGFKKLCNNFKKTTPPNKTPLNLR